MFEKGLNRDSNPQNQPENTYRDGVNLSLVRSPGAISQEVALEPIFTTLPSGSKVVGRAYFPNGEVLIFVKADSGSSIHLISGDSITLIFQDGDQSLNLGDLVQAVGTLNSRDEKVVYWTDEINVPRRLNINLLDSTLYTSTVDVGLYYSFDTVPTIAPAIAASGGTLKTGVYRIALALVDNEGAETPYLTVSQGVAVFPGGYLDARTTTGGESSLNTSRAISLLVTGLPTQGFRGIKLATIKNTEVRILGEYPLTGNYTINGSEAFTPGSLEEIVISSISYSGAKAITEQNDSIYLGNLTRGEDLGYQKYANYITLQGITEDFTAAKILESRSNNMKVMGPADNDHRRSEKFVFRKSFKRGETYAFYIALILKDGSETPAYHIPGRQAVGDENTATFPDPYDVSAIGFTRRFQQESKMGPNSLGYWENETEQYPDTDDFDIWNVDPGTGIGFATGNSIRTQKVRHHQFPDYFRSPALKSGSTEGSVTGVKLNNIRFPKEIKDQIVGYRIYYAERGFENQRVLDQSILVRCWNGEGFNDDFDRKYILPEPENNSNTNFGLTNPFKVAFPFHLMRTRKSATAIDYIKHITSLHAGGESGPYRGSIDPSVSNLPSQAYTRKVTFAAYVEHAETEIGVAVGNVDPGIFLNYLAPSALVLEVPNWTKPYNNDVVDFCRNLKTQYFPFYGQRLVWTGYQSDDLDATSSGDIYGGDTFITYHAYRAARPDDAPRSDVHLHQQVVESLDLIALRHEGNLIYETYFPKSEWFPGYDADDTSITERSSDDPEYNIRGPVAGENYNLYNDEFSSLNNIKIAFAWNPFTTNDTEFPTRIARSKKGSLRSFLSEDFRDLTTKRGEIVKLVAFGSDLLIHHESSLFTTRGSAELVTGDVRAFIGSGDILSVDPQELFTAEEGYAGLQNPHSSVLTPVGYAFADVSGKRMFLLAGGLKEISGPGSGLRDFFKDNLGGIVIPGYDPRYNRLFFSREGQWTLSFLPVEGVWESFHSGTPQAFFSDKNTLFSTFEGDIYRRGGTEGVYYGDIEDVELEMVHNRDPFIDKSISSMILDTSVFDSDGNEINDETFDDFRIFSDHQNTGVIPIIYFRHINGNARRTKRIWNVNQFRDEIAPTTYGGTLPAWVRRRMSGKVHNVRLRFTPEDGTKIVVFAVDLSYRSSIR